MITDLCATCHTDHHLGADHPFRHKIIVSGGDWERGYAKGYERALSQLVELIEYHIPNYADSVRHWANKLREEVLNDR